MDAALSLAFVRTRSIAVQIDALAEANKWAWVWSRPQWLEYELARNPRLLDLSFALVDRKNRVKAAQLLTYDRETLFYGLGDLPAPPPVVLRGAWSSTYRESCRRALMLQCSQPGTIKVRSPVWHPHFVGGIRRRPLSGVHPIYQTLRMTSANPRMGPWDEASHFTRVVDLSLPIEDLLRGCRKSYRHIIRDSREIVAAERDGSETAKLCREMHRASAGFVSRPTESWIMQDALAAQGDATWFVSRTPDGMPVGFAYVLHWNNYAYYASGATLGPDVAHGLQWGIIALLRECGIRHYELGWQGATSTQDDKGRKIEFFKRGFGGADYQQPVYRCTILGTMQGGGVH